MGGKGEMMQEQFSRTMLLIGEEALEKLQKSHVAVFGIGGVGGYVVEALARSGIGSFDLVDSDIVAMSNINRQIIATHKTLGMYKVDAAKERVFEINPYAKVNVYKTFYLPENAGAFDFTRYDYVVDAIDTVTGKLQLAEEAARCKTPIISSMGAGNKMDGAAFEVADIFETSVCPLAKVMRRELKKRGIEHLKVVYSKETPIIPHDFENFEKKEAKDAEEKVTEEKATGEKVTEGKTVHKRQIPGSMAFVPSVAGLIMAGEIVKDLTTKFQ